MTMPRARPDAEPTVTVVDLRCQAPDGVLTVGSDQLRLTWRVSPALPGLVQLAYEIEASTAGGFETVLASTGVVEGADKVAVPAPGPTLRSREVRFHRVRITTRHGWTDWSPVLRVEAGLLDAADWAALAVTLPDDPGADRQSPSPVLRREFQLPDEIVKARLYVTSLGVHHVTLNGRPVTDAILAPGWTTYRKRLIAESYDVTAMLARGGNVIAGILGDGWFRGRLGWDPDGDRCTYGRQVALIAQLEVDLADGTRHRIVTDRSWVASTTEIRSADLYDGSVIDLRERKVGFERADYDASDWLPVAVVPFDPSIIQPRSAPPVREVAVLPVERITRADGAIQLNGRQNVSGWVRLRVRGEPGDQVTVRHAEVLESDGSLHTRSLRSAKATDVYTLADDAEISLEPMFTFHGFQFAEVVTGAEVLSAEFVAISSDTPRRGHFECAEPPLNRLHENVVWSQRDNFVSVPTDCPQRDERLGWGGDAQAFAPTANTLFDAESFWASWLQDLALDQDDVLGVSTVVPDVVIGGPPRYGRAGWADAATIVPWAVYESYGDPHILRSQLDSMRRWIDSLVARRGPDGLLGTGMQFGDWLDPDAPAARPWEAKASSDYLANAFFALSSRLAGDAAELLGEQSRADEWHALSRQVSTATWARWADHAVTTQTGCAVALEFGLVPVAEREAVATALSRLVREVDGRVSTGFLGTPLILPALAGAGLIDEAYLMLLRREIPSWLYQVDQGATTVWERWDAIRADGSIHPGSMTTPPNMPARKGGEPHMLSFNHYAYGAVIDWVYRNVAGLAPDRERPGYRGVVFAPKPAVGIDWARASVESAYGTVAIEWRIGDAGALFVEVELPFGTSGTFLAPVTDASRVTIDGADADERAFLGPGRHVLSVTRPRIAAGRGATTRAAPPVDLGSGQGPERDTPGSALGRTVG
jgi:alpha-L-rhamnosidase